MLLERFFRDFRTDYLIGGPAYTHDRIVYHTCAIVHGHFAASCISETTAPHITRRLRPLEHNFNFQNFRHGSDLINSDPM